MAGHSVTDEQKVCKVGGIVGHMDCKIDGVVTDVKSASAFGFKKFKEGKILNDDPFGYVDQIRAYAHSEKSRDIGWLAIDKTNGHLTYLKYNMDGKEFQAYEEFNGNLKLAIGCSYCQYKKHCYPELKLYNYSYAPKYLCKVVKEPNVQELKF